MRLPVCMSMMDQLGGGGGVYHVRLPVSVSMMDQCVCVGGGGGGVSTMCDCLSVCP